MDSDKQKLKLGESIAAVRFGEFAGGDHITGVAEIIPAGEIVQVVRQAPVVDHLRQIEWHGTRYGVFGEDLIKRTLSSRPELALSPGSERIPSTKQRQPDHGTPFPPEVRSNI